MTDPDSQSLNPSTTSPLPEMTRSEATFHASVAGVRGAKSAESIGCDPAHADALGAAAVGGKVIGGLLLPLPCAYSALSVPALSATLEKHGVRVSGLQSDCLFIAAFSHPREVYRLAAVQGDAADARALVAIGDQIALTLLTRDHIDAAVEWCMDAFGRLNGVKKPQPAPEDLPPELPPSSASPATAKVTAADPAG